MQCSKMQVLNAPATEVCPHCGTYTKDSTASPGSLSGPRRPALLITVCLPVLLADSGFCRVWRLLVKQSRSTAVPQSNSSQPSSPEHHLPSRGQFRRNMLWIMAAWCSQPSCRGTALYFAPMGRQAIPHISGGLLRAENFQIKITMLPAVERRKFLVRALRAINAVPKR